MILDDEFPEQLNIIKKRHQGYGGFFEVTILAINKVICNKVVTNSRQVQQIVDEVGAYLTSLEK